MIAHMPYVYILNPYHKQTVEHTYTFKSKKQKKIYLIHTLYVKQQIFFGGRPLKTDHEEIGTFLLMCAYLGQFISNAHAGSISASITFDRRGM